MKDDEYYKTISKTAENWRRQNIFALQEIGHVANTVQPAVNMLRDLERSMVDFRSMQEQIRALSTSIPRSDPIIGLTIRDANLQISDVLVSLRPYQDFTIRLQEDQRKWAESLKASIGTLSQVTGIATIIERDFSLIANSTIFAQQSVARINLQAIEDVVKIENHVREVLYQPLREMADSYHSLWSAFRIDSQMIFSVPSMVITMPSVEMYLATHQTEVSIVEAEIMADEEQFLAQIELNKPHMDKIITSVDERLIPLYQGAINAIASDNIDNVRHATTSLRELVTQILHKLAPDEDFFDWDKDNLYRYDGRPTRKGRLLYICRNINSDSFATFVDRDVAGALSFLDLLQKGTHAIEKPYDERQMKALLIRFEHLIDFIIRISEDT